MIRLSLLTGSVTRELSGPYAGVKVTVRRLNSPQYRDARVRAQDLIRDKARLADLLSRHNLLGTVPKLAEALNNVDAMLGIAEWIANVECAVEAVEAWEGVADQNGAVIEPTRAALEVALLDETFAWQLMAIIEEATRILVKEAGFSKPSADGGAAAPPADGGLTGAETAERPARPAPKAARTARGGSARKSKTRRAP